MLTSERVIEVRKVEVTYTCETCGQVSVRKDDIARCEMLHKITLSPVPSVTGDLCEFETEETFRQYAIFCGGRSQWEGPGWYVTQWQSGVHSIRPAEYLLHEMEGQIKALKAKIGMP